MATLRSAARKRSAAPAGRSRPPHAKGRLRRFSARAPGSRVKAGPATSSTVIRVDFVTGF